MWRLKKSHNHFHEYLSNMDSDRKMDFTIRLLVENYARMNTFNLHWVNILSETRFPDRVFGYVIF